MNAHRVAPSHVLASGLVLGVAGDALLRAPGAPGLNLFVWAAAVAAATLLLHRRGGGTLSTEALVWLGIGVLFCAGMAWRDSPALKLLALGSAIVAFALPALRAGAAWIRRSGIADYIGALAAAAAHAAAGAVLVLVNVDWSSLRANPEQGKWRHAAGVARGVAIVTPVVIVFGGLFIAADEVFAGMVADAVRIDLETLASHIVLIGFLSWVATGYVRGFLTGTRLPTLDGFTHRRPTLSIIEAGVALAVLDLLFLTFVVVQFRYLFGGSALVEVTPGLTYAEYARRGFFELVFAAALVLPLLLSADALLQRSGRHDEGLFRTLTGVLIVLVLAVMASALQRMRIYQEAYGMTELRFYATALLALLAVVLLWFAATVLRGRRRPFAFGTLVAVLTTVVVLFAANPDMIIARTNVARVQSGGEGADTRFDIAYATSLSADAVPVLLAGLRTLPESARCPIARRLLQRWGPDTRLPLRTWSWSAARARSAVRGQEAPLRAAAGSVNGNCSPQAAG